MPPVGFVCCLADHCINCKIVFLDGKPPVCSIQSATNSSKHLCNSTCRCLCSFTVIIHSNFRKPYTSPTRFTLRAGAGKVFRGQREARLFHPRTLSTVATLARSCRGSYSPIPAPLFFICHCGMRSTQAIKHCV